MTVTHTMAAAGQTSLQRLLALDKTFDEFDDCIHAAADILSISLHDSAIVTSKVGGYSRFDFVLRWILDKLTKDAAIRGNPLAWSLLVRILTALPQNISSRLLVRSGLTATVIKTLDEHFGGLNVDAEKPANNQPTGAQISAKSEPTKSTKSKKRKRSDAVDAIPEVASQRNGIFTQLSRLFHTIALPSIDQHIVPFIRLWTHALITISGHAVGCNFSELERLLSAETHLLISLWTKNTRSMVRTEAHAAFAEEIAWPVSVFASQCSGLGINGPSLLLRQLLSKTYLRPSHDSYIKSSLSGKHTQISKDSVHAVFTSLSESIHQFMSVEGVSLQAREKVTVSVLSMLFDGIAGLKLQLAPREKRAHNKWTEAVFLELSSMIEKLSTHGDSHQLKKRLIKVMLDHIAHDVQALGNTILENISVNYTGLTHPPSTSEEASLLDLALIAQIIRLGPTVFNQGQQNPLLSLRNFLDNINLCLSREVGPESTEKEWARQIVVPLIQAQTQSQRVETFFQVWSDTLSTYDLAGAGPWRIWQEPEVRLALARLLELNLDINRSRLILDRATTDFVLSISKKPRGSGQKPLSIDTALLQIAVIVDVIRSDDTIDALREDFQRLLSLLVESFQTLLERETPRTHFWESLIRLHHHVAPDSDSIPDTAFLSKTVQEQTSCVEDAATLVLKATKKKTALTTDVLAALSYLLQTCTIGKELDVEIRLKAPSLEKLLTKHEDALTDAKCKEGLYAVTALLFPGRTSTSGLASELHNGVDGTHETGSELALDGIPEIVLDGWDQPLSQARVLSVLGLVKTCRDPRVFNASMHTLKPIVRDRVRTSPPCLVPAA